jgi:hypothetical protein
MDKESLDLVKNAYKDAKFMLNQNFDKLIEFSELLKNNTIVTKNDL